MSSAARERQELRPHLRDEQPPDDRVVVVRGGPSTIAKLAEHAHRTHDAFVLNGQPLWGISVFCALDDIGQCSLDWLLRRFSSYRIVHLASAGQLRAAGFALFPSFGRPHYTAKIASAGQTELTHLLEALCPPEKNRYHRGRRPGGR